MKADPGKFLNSLGIKIRDGFDTIHKKILFKVILCFPIAFLVFKMTLMNLNPVVDPDSHGFVGRYFLGYRSATFSFIYIQGKILSLLPFSYHVVMTISRFITSALFLLGVFYGGRMISKEYRLLSISTLCLFFLNIRYGALWDRFVVHGVWYYALNFFFFTYLCSVLHGFRHEVSKSKALLFFFLCGVAFLNRISLFLPLFFVTFFYYVFTNFKSIYLKLGIVQLGFFSSIYFLLAAKANKVLSKGSLDHFVFPRSHFYDSTEPFFSFFDFLVVRTKSLYDGIQLPFVLLVGVSLLSLFFLQDKKTRIYVLSYWTLFFSYLFLTFFGKFTFMYFRYAFEMVFIGVVLFLRFSYKAPSSGLGLGVFFLVLLSMSVKNNRINPGKEYARYALEREQFDKLVTLSKSFKKDESLLVSHNAIQFLSAYFKDLEKIDIGFHQSRKTSYSKKSIESIKPGFFDKNRFGFASWKCKFSKKTKSRYKLCSAKNYLDYSRIKNDFRVEDEVCYFKLCFSIFSKILKKHAHS